MHRHFAQANDLAHDLGVITLRLRFAVNVADIVADTLFLFLQPLDALDEKAQLLVGGRRFAHFILRRMGMMGRRESPRRPISWVGDSWPCFLPSARSVRRWRRRDGALDRKSTRLNSSP